LTTAETAGELRFAPPGPGFWEQDPVHFPRALTRYWTEVHPAPFAKGTADFASFYGMLIGGLQMAYVNGIGYKTVLPAPEEEVPQRFRRAKEVFAGKLWREQLREWDETYKPAAIAKHRELQAVDADALLAREAAELEPVEAAGFVVTWRPPDSRDVAAAASTRDAAGAERLLLERCVTDAAGPGGEADGPSLPREVREAVAAAMAEADPLAEVLVDVSCPACETAFTADLDLGGFVWAEVRARALALLRDVDALARAYGWTEPDVLALDGRRRAAYLELVREGVA